MRICESKRVRERRVVVVTGVASGEEGDRQREKRERGWLQWRRGRERKEGEGSTWLGLFITLVAIVSGDLLIAIVVND